MVEHNVRIVCAFDLLQAFKTVAPIGLLPVGQGKIRLVYIGGSDKGSQRACSVVYAFFADGSLFRLKDFSGILDEGLCVSVRERCFVRGIFGN